eukprot:GCRY01004251.1.p1 GENE.GCRY01004251.1~~GCRY01004251.1.p1  ORF type:complete len:304 (+),score=36.89 GCRY01004251.1:277-1188(+)
MFALIFVALGCAWYGTWRALELDQDSKECEEITVLNGKHVILWPILSTLSLIALFYFFDALSVIILFSIVASSIFSVAFFLFPYFSHTICPLFSIDSVSLFGFSLPLSHCLSFFSAGLCTYLWLLTSHWLIIDVIGLSLCIFVLSFVRIPNLKLSIILLSALFVYDLSFVYFSSTVIGDNMMVAVAQKTPSNPLRSFTHNAPTEIELPTKLLIPFAGSLSESGFSMLGLGDIVIPGLVLVYLRSFDLSAPQHSADGAQSPSPSSSCFFRLLLKWNAFIRWELLDTYFGVGFLGYGLGLYLVSD